MQRQLPVYVATPRPLQVEVSLYSQLGPFSPVSQAVANGTRATRTARAANTAALLALPAGEDAVPRTDRRYPVGGGAPDAVDIVKHRPPYSFRVWRWDTRLEL